MPEFMLICPHCKQALDVDDNLRGQTAECPACNRQLTVPNAAKKTINEHRPSPITRAVTVPRLRPPVRIVVSTGDIPGTYTILGPVFFCLTNRGIFSSQYKRLAAEYASLIQQAKTQRQVQTGSAGLGEILMFLAGDINFEAHQYELALFIGIEEMKKRVSRLGGNGLAWLRHDLDIDPTGLEFFYLQMTGTAVFLEQTKPGNETAQQGTKGDAVNRAP